ncbi:MAG TPA: rhodanese-like domain-containing protein [Thermoplasmata archaeon]|nr:rhodanese-like domain-containing protein [Thermoplasmata archaeon]
MLEQLDPGAVAQRLRAKPDSVVLLDVRESFERELASIDPSLHIPMGDVPARLEEIPRDRQVVVYCHSGARSLMVAGFLAENGFSKVANLSGGIDAWSVRVDPKVPRYS